MSGMDKIEPPTIADDIGSLHPLNQTKDYLLEMLSKLGFQKVEVVLKLKLKIIILIC